MATMELALLFSIHLVDLVRSLVPKQGRNRNMPHCCAGIFCKHPELGLHSGHGGIKNCPDCGEKIHDPCAIIDEDAELSKMNVCPACFGARKPPAEDHFPTEESARSNTLSALAARGTIDREQAEEPKAKRGRALRKTRNSFVCEQFDVLQGSFSEGGTFRCMHCNEQTFTWHTWNSSKARSHLERCCDTPQEVRVAVTESSQASRKKLKTASSALNSATASMAPEEEKSVILGLEEQIKNMKATSKREANKALEKSRQDIEKLVVDYENKISELDLGKKEVELELARKNHELAKMKKDLLAAKHAEFEKSAKKRGDK
jgi:hypothetical protein